MSEPPTPPPEKPRLSFLEMFPTEFPPQSYPNSGPLAVGARLLLLLALTAVVVAALAHPFKPRLVGHWHVQRFAAWFLLSAVVAAALPRARLRWLGLGMILFACAAELARATPGPFVWGVLRGNVYADMAGVYALYFALALARWREAVLPPGVRPGR